MNVYRSVVCIISGEYLITVHALADEADAIFPLP